VGDREGGSPGSNGDATRPIPASDSSRRTRRRLAIIGRMATNWTQRQRLFRTIGIVSLVILALDIILVNVLGDVSDNWWVLLIGVGWFVVGAVAIVSFVWLLVDRNRSARV
jgi:hypothetical protein